MHMPYAQFCCNTSSELEWEPNKRPITFWLRFFKNLHDMGTRAGHSVGCCIVELNILITILCPYVFTFYSLSSKALSQQNILIQFMKSATDGYKLVPVLCYYWLGSWHFTLKYRQLPVLLTCNGCDDLVMTDITGKTSWNFRIPPNVVHLSPKILEVIWEGRYWLYHLTHWPLGDMKILSKAWCLD